MNHAVGHFLFTESRSTRTGPYWNLLRLFFLIVLFISFQNSIFSQNPGDLLRNADEYYEKEQFHTASKYYQVAVGVMPDDPETNYRLAQCYRAVFDYPMAANYFKKTMELDELSYPLSSFYLAIMQKSMGNFKKARDGFEHFIETNKNTSLISALEKSIYMKQAEIEMESSQWAIEQLGKSWTDMGFMNLPQPVNSLYNDYAAVSGADNETITITSGRKGVKGSLVDNRFGDYFTDNFRYTKRDEQWVQQSTSDHFDRTNTKFSDGVGSYNSSRDKYYFTSCYEGSAFCKLYVTYKEDGVWKNPRLLNENVNAPGYDNKHPALTAGGDTLIFVSNRPGGVGGNDLWMAVSKNGDEWEQPQPLPGAINTPFNEASPFIYTDNLLFFSSDGHSGMGGMDIFMAKGYNSSESGIQNLGTPFNSGHDDGFFSVREGKGYLSSNRPGGAGKFDIYTFNFPDESNNLGEFLEESAEGTHLRSRIRVNDGSNLYAARDEDQFYYDNLSAEDRARLDRIISAKQDNSNDFNASKLSKEDFKYYNKLDIGTKAIIERLALRKARELEGLTPENQMTAQEKLDWEYYQSIEGPEKETIDRILNARVEGRRIAMSKLTAAEREYAADSVNKQRIESKVQLRSLNSLAEVANANHQRGVIKYQQNEHEITTFNISPVDPQYTESRAAEYKRSIVSLGPDYLNYYHSLTPEQQDNIHKSALRLLITEDAGLSQQQKDELLSEFNLAIEPFNISSVTPDANELQMSTEIRKALGENVASLVSENPLREQLKLELGVQQMMLEQQLNQLSQKEAVTLELQGQLQQYITEQGQTDQPELETRLIDEFYRHLYQLPLLTPKDSYYFNTLSPGQQLRIERLVVLVDEATRKNLPAAEQQFLSDQSATDQWYYLELPEHHRKIVRELVERGWDPERPYDLEYQNFIAGLSDLDKDRIDRLMGHGSELNFEVQQEGRVAIDNSKDFTIDSTSIQSSESRLNSEKPVREDQDIATVRKDTSGTRIYFDFDRSRLRSEARKTLEEIDQIIKQSGKPVKVLIEGHTDNIGSESYNLALGRKRSQTAADFFRSKSGNVEVSTVSQGELRPAYDNSTSLGRQLNRRVEVKVEGISFQSPLITYLVKPNVTLAMIAAATGISEDQIMVWNDLRNKQLKPNQPIRLPVSIGPEKLESILYYPQETQPTSKENEYHTVAEGESLYKLARMYGTSVQKLEDLNGISATDLVIGQQIRVW